ncbi:MAG: cytochrome c maturation protein CcmE [Chloroflexi bacterium]|nr:cytochrome c maturation protein CcmE [Chloroflexota bacterium]
MAQVASRDLPIELEENAGGRTKFLVGGGLLLAAVVYLIVGNLMNGQQYFVTVDQLVAGDYTGEQVRASGVVLGETIQYDGETLSFEMAHLPTSAADIADEGGLAEALHQAANVQGASRVTVVLFDEPKPDLLQHEAQAIVTGYLDADGVFYADDLLLKCPTRYEDALPEQVGEALP